MDSLSAIHSSPTVSDYSFQPSPEVDFTNLFEQCGIPLADLSAQIYGLQSSTPTKDSSSATSWYAGTAPADGDIVELVDDHQDVRTKASACTDENRQRIADSEIDGSGSDSVSKLGGEGHVSVSLQGTEYHEAADLRSSSGRAEDSRRSNASKSPKVPSRSRTDVNRGTSTHAHPQSKSPLQERLSFTKAESAEPVMDFYNQQQFYSSAQLSSPVSMKSSTGDNDSFLYTPEFSPQFSSYAGQDVVLNSLPGESEAMRRSRSTPFLGQRPTTPFRRTVDAANSVYTVFPTFEQQGVVPASDHGAWQANGTYSPPGPRQHQAVYGNTGVLPMSAPRLSMKRKHRPVPIATSLSNSGMPASAQTAPLERRMMRDSLTRLPLSAKRSFEDFSELEPGLVDVSPYRPVSTPTSKRARSALSASPFVDEPLFSPVYMDTNGLALHMDPEQILLSSPPYTQIDFCSSPNYLRSNEAGLINNNYIVPGAMLHAGHLYNHEPMSPVDMDPIWANKGMYCSPQAAAQPTYATPRTLSYDQPSPLRKSAPRNRNLAAARAISFCNYTAADKKTILSGVAPSGSNKKAVTKAQEMSRSRSSGAIAAV